ncbi:PA14 domain-containing protein [Streptomyces sp. MBT42]|uniref:fibronectin type III domain-containing protein n=1 Tax=unclassified Streptomyces TaxID=2593676 RepID=UPI001E633A0B|nr:PA14 domain-containing protein [Streptomyces sp. MBT42]MCD2465893.1 PA14 domain-containing protein [Streptomyces sp. MBT42]
MTTRNRLSALATTAALAASGGLLTATPAAAAVTCAAPVWKAEYYANTTLTGTPKLTTCDSVIAENYGTGDPAGVTLPRDNFSVRWSVTRDFGSGGPFTFTAEAQDGIRVTLDGVRKIDLWKNVSTTQKKTAAVTVPAGRHTIHVSYATWTGAANVKFGYTPNTSATVDRTRPLAPAGASLAYDRALNRATVKWAANKEMDLAGYRVYRRPSTSATWTKVSGSTALVTGTSYVNSPPATGERFLYELRAVDRAGNESAGGTDLTVASVDRTAPAAPTGVTADDGTPGVTLTWKPVAGAAKYQVHRQRKGTTDPVAQVATGVTGTTWTDAGAAERTAYTYWVSAVDAAGNASARTAVTATHDDWTAPAAVKGLTATAREDGVHLAWTPNTEGDLKRYEVFKATLWDDGEGGTAWVAHRVEYLLPTASSYVHESAADGETVLYAVIAVDTANNMLYIPDPAIDWVEVTELGTPDEG